MNEEAIEEIRKQKLNELQESLDAAGQPDSPKEPIEIRSQTEFDSVIQSHPLVLVDFYADWCGPCQMMEPTINDIASKPGVVVAKVDVDANQALAGAFNVRGVPTLLLFVDGQQVQQLVGMQQSDRLQQVIEQYTPV